MFKLCDCLYIHELQNRSTYIYTYNVLHNISSFQFYLFPSNKIDIHVTNHKLTVQSIRKKDIYTHVKKGNNKDVLNYMHWYNEVLLHVLYTHTACNPLT